MRRWITLLSSVLGLLWLSGGAVSAMVCTAVPGQSGWIVPGSGACGAGTAEGRAVSYTVRESGGRLELEMSRAGRAVRWTAPVEHCSVTGARVGCSSRAEAVGRSRDVRIRAVFGRESVDLRASGGIYGSAERDSSVILTASSYDARAGAPVTLTAQVEPAGATGHVRFATLRGDIARVPVSGGVATTRWRPEAGATVVRAIYRGDGAHAPSVSPSITVRALGAEALFAEAAPTVSRALDHDIARSTRARRRHAAWMRDQGRARLRDGDTAVSATNRRLMAQELNSGRRLTTFDGRYAHRADRGSHRRFVYADLDVEQVRGQEPGISLNTAMVFEKRLAGRSLGGLYVGAEMGRSRVGHHEMSGRIETFGVNAGTYGMRRLGGDVVVEAFAEVARLWQDMDLESDRLTLSGRRPGTSLHFGTAISGVHDMERLTLTPEMTFDHAVTWADGMDMAIAGGGVGHIAGHDFRTTRISATPRLRRSVPGWDGHAVTLSPRTICERATGRVDRSGCGLALGMGYEADFADGRGALETDFGVENLNGTERQRMSFNVTFEF